MVPNFRISSRPSLFFLFEFFAIPWIVVTPLLTYLVLTQRLALKIQSLFHSWGESTTRSLRTNDFRWSNIYFLGCLRPIKFPNSFLLLGCRRYYAVGENLLSCFTNYRCQLMNSIHINTYSLVQTQNLSQQNCLCLLLLICVATSWHWTTWTALTRGDFKLNGIVQYWEATTNKWFKLYRAFWFKSVMIHN